MTLVIDECTNLFHTLCLSFSRFRDAVVMCVVLCTGLGSAVVVNFMMEGIPVGGLWAMVICGPE